MLVDHAVIYVRSGRGGNGSASFRREKFVPKGGPDGGDGGDGGDVILVGDPHLDTLLTFRYQPHYRTAHGEHGGRKSCYGKRGEDRVVQVPIGTIVHDEGDDSIVADISEPGQAVVVAKGGKGGLGNLHFKTATHQAPTEFTPGGEMIERTLRLELKLIADIGVVGLPNAGKSTLLRAVSRANPKVADYPFTTLSAQLGIAELPGDRRLVVADIPGLIEGASQGAGLGHDFLRHIERTRAIVHVVDIAPIDGSDPVGNYRVIRRELFEYSRELAEKPELLVLNKIDLIGEADRERLIESIAGQLGFQRGERPLVISGVASIGIRELLETAWKMVRGEQAPVWAARGTGE